MLRAAAFRPTPTSTRRALRRHRPSQSAAEGPAPPPTTTTSWVDERERSVFAMAGQPTAGDGACPCGAETRQRGARSLRDTLGRSARENLLNAPEELLVTERDEFRVRSRLSLERAEHSTAEFRSRRPRISSLEVYLAIRCVEARHPQGA